MIDSARISFDWLERRNQLSPNKEALVDIFANQTFTYKELNSRVNKLANGLRENWEFMKSDRIAILAKNCHEYIEAFFAVAKLGAILVPINIRLTGSELAYIFNDCQPKGLILGEEFVEVVTEIGAQINIQNFLLLDNAAFENMTPYEEFLAGFRNTTPELEEFNSLDDPQVILYTSGTTGYPKGAIQTHGNILFNSMNANLALDIVSTDITLCGLPLFHTGGLHVMTTPTLHAGGSVVIERSFDAEEALGLIDKKRVNTVFFVSTMWMFMAQHQKFEQTDFSNLRLAWTGGAPCPIPTIEAYLEKGVQFRQGYGLTEVGPDAMILPAEEAIRKAGSIGLPPFHSAMRIVNDNNENAKCREIGELIFRGPTVTPGYWNNPKATAEAIVDGWFHTGDLAYIDEDGYVFIVDRAKDLVISGGENIYPAEIEKEIYKHPKISEVAVIGIPNQKWGEVCHAIICLKPGENLTEKEIIDFLQGKLARFKIPKSVSFMDALIRNPAGKVLKRVLREPYWKGYDKKVH